MNWFKKRRIATLKVQLAGAIAADRCEREIANKTGHCYPTVLSANARRVAELEEMLRQATAEPFPAIDPQMLEVGK